MKKLIANIARLVYTMATKQQLPSISPLSPKKIAQQKPRFKVEYDPDSRMYWAYEFKCMTWMKISNTFMATPEGAEQRLRSYQVELLKAKDSQKYFY